MAREMKDSGVSWVERIPLNWSVLPLKSQISFGRGLPITKADLVEDGVQVVSYGQIHSKDNVRTHLKHALVRYVPSTFLTSNPDSLAEKGDIFFADTSEDYEGIGNAVLIDTDVPTFAGYHTVIVRPKEESNSKYLAYLFTTDAWRNQLRTMAWGIKVFSITQSMLRASSIILPPKDDQSRIVTFLDHKCAEIDSVIANTQRTIEEYKALKQSVITEAVTKGVRGKRPMKDSGIEWVERIPENWAAIRVKYLLKERNERSVEGLEEPLSMSQKLGLVPTKELDVIPNMASSFVGAKLAYVDDLVFNKLKAHLGVFSVSKYDGLVSPDYAVYYSTGKADLKFLEYLFKTPQCITEFRKKSTGIAAGLTRLYTDGLFSIVLPFPSIEEQKEIVAHINAKCNEINRLIAAKEQLLAELESYKKSVIYEYVTGKKEVPLV